MSFPALFHATDEESVSAQLTFTRLSAVRLVSLVAVAGIAVLTPLVGRWAPVIALVPITFAVCSELLLLIHKPDRRWHELRAIAESSKSLAWRYQVGGSPFGLGQLRAEEIDQNFLLRIKDIVDRFRGLALPPATNSQITQDMRKLRNEPLETRKSKYRVFRLDDQRKWYEEKAKYNRRLSTRYQVGLLVVEIVALGAAVVGAVWAWPISVYSIFSALAIAGVGWFQIKRYSSHAETYAVASHELASVISLIDSIRCEEDWEEFVAEAEQIISREHSVWLGSHSMLPASR